MKYRGCTEVYPSLTGRSLGDVLEGMDDRSPFGVLVMWEDGRAAYAPRTSEAAEHMECAWVEDGRMYMGEGDHVAELRPVTNMGIKTVRRALDGKAKVHGDLGGRLASVAGYTRHWGPEGCQ